jgi:hypothetical protein
MDCKVISQRIEMFENVTILHRYTNITPGFCNKLGDLFWLGFAESGTVIKDVVKET